MSLFPLHHVELVILEFYWWNTSADWLLQERALSVFLFWIIDLWLRIISINNSFKFKTCTTLSFPLVIHVCYITETNEKQIYNQMKHESLIYSI